MVTKTYESFNEGILQQIYPLFENNFSSWFYYLYDKCYNSNHSKTPCSEPIELFTFRLLDIKLPNCLKWFWFYQPVTNQKVLGLNLFKVKLSEEVTDRSISCQLWIFRQHVICYSL